MDWLLVELAPPSGRVAGCIAPHRYRDMFDSERSENIQHGACCKGTVAQMGAGVWSSWATGV